MVKNLQQDGQAPEWFHPSYWVPLGWMLLRICKVVIGQDLRPRPGKVPEGSAGSYNPNIFHVFQQLGRGFNMFFTSYLG